MPLPTLSGLSGRRKGGTPMLPRLLALPPTLLLLEPPVLTPVVSGVTAGSDKVAAGDTASGDACASGHGPV